MSRRRTRQLGWVAGTLLMAGIGATAFLLIGAAEQGDEVLTVDAAVYLEWRIRSDVQSFSSEEDFVAYVCLTVTSPTRGAVTQLRAGNFRLYDPINAPFHTGDPKMSIKEDHEVSVQVAAFHNIGGGVYCLELRPEDRWMPSQLALHVEVQCPYGHGMTVFEVPLQDFDCQCR